MMAGIDELAAIVRAGLDADELWATEASRNDDNPVVNGGEHWHWECSGHDIEATPQPGLDEHLVTGQCECFTMSFRSREKYTMRYASGLLSHIMFRSDEVPPAVAGHLTRHDPARVLLEVASKRALLDEALSWEHRAAFSGVRFRWCGVLEAPPGSCDCGRDARVHAVLTHLAQPYREAT